MTGWTEPRGRTPSACVLAIVAPLALGACGIKGKGVLIENQGPPMVEQLRRGASGGVTSSAPRVERDDAVRDNLAQTAMRERPARAPVPYEAWVRDARNETEELFPLLPNPEITMFRFPHLATSGRLGVPGYTTAVTLYERDEYALPGEVAPIRRLEPSAETE